MIGKNLSHYLIESELGRGGMGIVYRALDTKLDRTVAIKVLPSAALATDDDRARFYREAKAAAALTHPHIAIIYGVDEAVPEDAPHRTEPSPFIAMEFIDGETLEEKIKRGPLALDEAVRIGKEIASALKLAHEKDIVHRDIKAANVMLAGDGTAKVLDFGLAQTAQSTKLTRLGATLGTAAYMSPEQARGELVDARSDLWSIGVTLFEMISGSPPFSIEYEQAALYSILNEDPEPLTALRTGVPFEVERIVMKCLMKDRDRRYQHAADLIADLAGVDLTSPGTSRISTITTPSTGPASALSTAVQPVAPENAVGIAKETKSKLQINGTTIALIAASLIVGFMIAFLAIRPEEPTRSLPVNRMTVEIPGVMMFWVPTSSPDGQMIVFRGLEGNTGSGLYVHDLSDGTTSQITDAELNPSSPKFSPDGTQIVYETVRGLRRSLIDDPVPLVVTDFRTEGFMGWLDNETILFRQDDVWLIQSIITSAREPYFGSKFIDGFDSAPEGIAEYFFISPIPEQRSALLNAAYTDSSKGWDVFYLKDGKASLLLSDATWPRYSKDGFLTYTDTRDHILQGRFLSQLFDPQTGVKSGATVPVVTDDILQSWRSTTAHNGAVWISNMGLGSVWNNTIEQVDPNTGTGNKVASDYSFQNIAASDDSNRILFTAWNLDQNRHDVYVLDSNNSRPRLILQNGGIPEWYSGADRILINRGGDLIPYTISSAVYGNTIVQDVVGRHALSGDDQWVAYSKAVDGDIHLMAFNQESGNEITIDGASGHVQTPSFSADDNFVVAIRHQDGEKRAVAYAFPTGNPFVVADEEARFPQWSHDMNWIYYGKGPQLRRVSVDIRGGFPVFGTPETVYENPLFVTRTFTVSGDGSIYVGLRDPTDRPNEKARLILNWGDELRRRANVQ